MLLISIYLIGYVLFGTIGCYFAMKAYVDHDIPEACWWSFLALVASIIWPLYVIPTMGYLTYKRS